jgi:hypothetical protein
MNYFRLTIVGDTNDADYVTEVSKISEETLENVIKPIVSVLQKNTFNWNISEYIEEKLPIELYAGLLTQAQIDDFSEFCPYGEDGIHTITSINITPFVREHILFSLF